MKIPHRELKQFDRESFVPPNHLPGGDLGTKPICIFQKLFYIYSTKSQSMEHEPSHSYVIVKVTELVMLDDIVKRAKSAITQ